MLQYLWFLQNQVITKLAENEFSELCHSNEVEETALIALEK